jgi:hypothetical protein
VNNFQGQPNDAFFFVNGVMFTRWGVLCRKGHTWNVGLTCGVAVMRAVFGADVFTRRTSGEFICDDFGNLVEATA